MLASGTVALTTWAWPRLLVPTIWPRRDFEGERRGVDVVVFAIDEDDGDIDHREADERARGQNRLVALLDARDVFLWDGTANDLRVELVTLAGARRRDLELDLRKLAGATRLLLVRIG